MYHLMLFSVYPLCFLCLCSSLSAYFWINWTFFRIPFYMKFCLFRCSTLNLEIVIVPCSHKAPMVHYATVICITCIQYKPEKMLKFLTYKNYFNIKFKILTFLHILNELKEREKKCSLIRNWSIFSPAPTLFLCVCFSREKVVLKLTKRHKSTLLIQAVRV